MKVADTNRKNIQKRKEKKNEKKNFFLRNGNAKNG